MITLYYEFDFGSQGMTASMQSLIVSLLIDRPGKPQADGGPRSLCLCTLDFKKKSEM